MLSQHRHGEIGVQSIIPSPDDQTELTGNIILHQDVELAVNGLLAHFVSPPSLPLRRMRRSRQLAWRAAYARVARQSLTDCHPSATGVPPRPVRSPCRRSPSHSRSVSDVARLHCWPRENTPSRRSSTQRALHSGPPDMNHTHRTVPWRFDTLLKPYPVELPQAARILWLKLDSWLTSKYYSVISARICRIRPKFKDAIVCPSRKD